MRTNELKPDLDNATLEQLQAAVEVAPNRRSYIRLAAMRCLLRGMNRQDVSETFCRSECMVRLWIIKYNHGGIDALISKPGGGRKCKVSLQRLEEVLVSVLKEPAQAAMEHCTGVKVHGWLQQRFKAELSYSTVVRYLHDLDFHLRVPRPWPLPLLDEPERETHPWFLPALFRQDRGDQERVISPTTGSGTTFPSAPDGSVN